MTGETFKGEPPTYQFDNCLWIGFHGGYGMFVDNLEARLPINTDERWLRASDERDEYGMFCDFICEGPNGDRIASRDWTRAHAAAGYKLVDDPNYEPKFREERMLPGQPDYEAVLCHECAHAACDALPWLHKLINPHNSHAHRSAWMAAHPDHYGWDYDRHNATD